VNATDAKKLLLAVVILVVGCAGSFYAGRKTNPDKKVVQAMQAVNKSMRNQIYALTKEITLLKQEKTKVTVTKFSPTTGKKTSQRTSESTSTEALIKSTVGITGTENTRSASLTQSNTLEERSQSNWNVALLGGLSPNAKWLVGAHVQYRVIGPLTAGGWAAGGPGLVVGGLSIGVQF
jgi:uncharacterized protein (UPF0333 family)